MGTVFINYRRHESPGEARALFNELVARLGKDSVFMDVDSIALGRDFRQVLQERLASCDLMLALIGKDWVDAKNPSGRRCLEDPSDFVRLEIEAALKRNIPVTPVLVQGAQMPTVEQLPEAIRDFAYRNGFELSHNRWESDVQEMLKRLGLSKQRDPEAIREIGVLAKKTPAESAFTEARGPGTGAPAAQQPARKHWFAIIGASVVAIAVAGGGLFYYRTVAEENARIEQAQVESAKANAYADAQVTATKAEADKARADAEATKATAAAQVERDRAAAAQVERDRAAAARAESAKREAEALRKVTNFAGIWIESNPEHGLPMRLDIRQNGSEIVDRLFLGRAMVTEGKAVWTRPQGCAEQFRKPGYNYDNPGVNAFSVRLDGPILVYERDTTWIVPCNGHPIGTERTVWRLKRVP